MARGAFAILIVAVTYMTLTVRPDDMKAGFDLTDWIAGILFGRPDLGDKVAHFLAYGSLGFMSGAAQLKLFERSWPVVASLAGYGAVLEGVQHLGGVRHADALDATANAVGAASGLAAFLVTALLVRKAASA
ncbi:MAG: hypothetical protein ABL957_14980 [Parvularculaceae bacterium]